MKLIIAGGRDYRLTFPDFARLNTIHAKTPITEVVSGGARGADTDGETWASRNGIKVAHFYPNWAEFGKAAGPTRNSQMAEYTRGGACVLFPGGSGTDDMAKKAIAAGLTIHDFRGAK